MERFAAFRHANFRRYFAGQVISSVGTWLQALAVTWLVLDLTGRSDRLGIAVALQFLPLLLLGAPAGVLADRVDNRRLLMATSAVSAVLALAFGLVVSAGTPDLGVIYGLTFASGLVLAVERPAMQALLFQLVGRDTLPSAVAANSTIASVSRLVGPALGGAMVAVTGVASCFYANAVSYVVVLAALASISRSRLVPRPTATRSAGNLRAAVGYVRHSPRRASPARGDGGGRAGGPELPDHVPVDGAVRLRPRGRRRGHGDERECDRLDPGRHLRRRYHPEPPADARADARRVQHDAPRARRRPELRDVRRARDPAGVRLGVLPVDRHRRRPAGDRPVDAGPRRWHCTRWPGSAAPRSVRWRWGGSSRRRHPAHRSSSADSPPSPARPRSHEPPDGAVWRTRLVAVAVADLRRSPTGSSEPDRALRRRRVGGSPALRDLHRVGERPEAWAAARAGSISSRHPSGSTERAASLGQIVAPPERSASKARIAPLSGASTGRTLRRRQRSEQ